MNYDNWTDFAINAAVGAATEDATGSEPCFSLVVRNSNGNKFDPCNSWADAGPIVSANRISLMFDRSTEKGNEEEWCLASSPDDQIIVDYVSSDKLLRAAMIVFLMMQESK